MPAKKIVLLGGGSGFFRTVIGELAITEELSGSDVVFYDVQEPHMEIIAKYGRRAVEQTGVKLNISWTTDLAKAVDGADFAVSSIGVSGPNRKYHELDITIPAKYGIYQTTGDTTGPGGLFAGFRSIPIFLGICREMEKRCPDVVFLNHSNPMVMICRAMIKHTGIKRFIGLCHGAQGTIAYLAQVLEVPVEELDVITVGLNHLLWVTRLRHHGKDLYPMLKEKLDAIEPPAGRIFCKKLFDIYGYYPVNEDRHIIEFYPFLLQAQNSEELPYSLRLRTKMIEESRTGGEDRWGRMLKQANGEEPVQIPKGLSPEAIGKLIAAISLNRRETHIVNIPNNGSVPNLPDYAIVEVQGVTDSQGFRGLYMGEIPLPVAGILQARVLQQELAVDAGVYGDRNLALQAFIEDESTVSIEDAEAMLDELLAAHADMLPQFSGGGL
jgi:alpha-galactosidase